MKPKTDIRTHPEWVELQLRNWARWCWSGPLPHPLPPAQCASLEGHYSRFGEESTTDDARPIPPDVDQAKIVQLVWESLPHWPQQVMRAEYPQRFESGRQEHGRAAAARWLHLSLVEYESYLSSAAYKVLIALGGER